MYVETLSLKSILFVVSNHAFVAFEGYQHAMIMYKNCDCLNKINVHQ